MNRVRPDQLPGFSADGLRARSRSTSHRRRLPGHVPGGGAGAVGGGSPLDLGEESDADSEASSGQVAFARDLSAADEKYGCAASAARHRLAHDPAPPPAMQLLACLNGLVMVASLGTSTRPHLLRQGGTGSPLRRRMGGPHQPSLKRRSWLSSTGGRWPPSPPGSS